MLLSAKRYTTILLDVDGTLVASNEAHAACWAEALEAFGYGYTYDQILPLIGMGADQLLPALGGPEADSAEGRRLIAHRGQLFKGYYIGLIKPVAGCRDFVDRAYLAGLEVVVASSASKSELADLLDIAGLGHLARHAVTADDAAASKPAPDVVLAALRKCHASPTEALMVGDTEYDLQAARTAGVDMLAVRTGGRTDAQLNGALLIADHVAQVVFG